MQIPKLKSLLIWRNAISSSSPCYKYAYFHSTPASLAKWKTKWNTNPEAPCKGQQPSKNYVRYATRQKRADAKKALNDLLFNSGCSELPLKAGKPAWEADEASSWDAEEAENAHGPNKKSRKKSRRSSRAGKGKSRRHNFSAEFDENSESVFQATFGNKCYTWSYRSREEPSFESSSAGFEWRDQSNWTSNKRRVWDSTSDTEDDDDKSYSVGSYSDRIVLGLPSTGPLKIEDVKSSFRSSALKWHPDKHQGPSQVQAEEKFKQCVDAYKALCKALS